jgi:hypothetical protein
VQSSDLVAVSVGRNAEQGEPLDHEVFVPLHLDGVPSHGEAVTNGEVVDAEAPQMIAHFAAGELTTETGNELEQAGAVHPTRILD